MIAAACHRRREHDGIDETSGMGYFIVDDTDGIGGGPQICEDCRDIGADLEAFHAAHSVTGRDEDGHLFISVGPER